MKMGAIVIVNCDRDNIWYCLRGIYDACDKIIVVHSGCNWNGKPKDDGTLKIVKSFEDSGGKIEIITGSYTSQPGQRTVALEILKNEDYDYCFVVDSDEIYHPKQLRWARRVIEDNPSIDIFSVRWRRLWKTLSYKLVPDDGEVFPFYKITDDFYFTERRGTTYRTRQLKEKAIAEQEREVRFAEKILKRRERQLKKEKRKKRMKLRERNVKQARKTIERERKVLERIKKQDQNMEGVQTLFLDPDKIVCYHLTCVCDNEQMLEKIQTRSYKDRVHPSWYECKWLNWTLETCDLHPTSPTQYRRAIPSDKTKLPTFMNTHRFW